MPAGGILPGQPLPMLGRIGISLALLLLVLFSFHEVGGMDEGFHLRAGEFILDGNGWPRTDPFTYTLTDRPYVDTSWGYQVLLALAHRLGGAPGMVLLHSAILSATAVLVYRTARLRRVSPTMLVAASAAACIAAQLRFEIRPEVFSYCFLALTLYLLARQEAGLRCPLFILPVVFVFWANCHSFFVLGWSALACHLIARLIRDRRLDPSLVGIVVLCVLAPFINPYGIRGVLFPLQLLTRFQQGNPFASSIDELLSPLSPSLESRFAFFPVWPIYAYRLLAAGGLFSLFGLWRQRLGSALLLVLVFGPVSALATRNMPILSIACLPGIVWGLSGLSAERTATPNQNLREYGRRGLQAVVALMLMGLSLRVLTDAYYIGYRQDQRFGFGWNRLNLPIDAVQYIRRAQLPGRMLNHLNFGGYLMWAQSEPVFIDGRLEVAGEEFFRQYNEIISSEPALERAVEQFGIGWIIYPYVANSRLTQRLSRDQRWMLVYFDHLAAIFVRSGLGRERFVDPAIITMAPQETPTVTSLPGLGGPPRLTGLRKASEGFVYRQHYPSGSYHRALFHMSRAEVMPAEMRLCQAIISSEGAYFECYRSLGALLQATGRLDEARRCYEIVLAARPEDVLAQKGLASLGEKSVLPAGH